jgi:quercetin dioxygenase-like cupin family protein
MMTKRQLWFAVIAATSLAALAGAVSATPGSGTTATVIARAAFADAVDLKLEIKDDHRGRDVIQVRNAGDTVIQQIVFAANGLSGWHSHPGPAIILIKSGQLTFYSADDPGCTGRTFLAGQAFIEPPGLVHFARNESSSQIAEVGVTYFDVPPGSASPRIDEPNPGNCPF